MASCIALPDLLMLARKDSTTATSVPATASRSVALASVFRAGL